MKCKVVTNSTIKLYIWSKHCSYLSMLLCCRIISSAEDVMERSLRLIEEARQVLQNPESPSNAQNLAQVAKDVSQVKWVEVFYGFMFCHGSIFSVCQNRKIHDVLESGYDLSSDRKKGYLICGPVR